MAKISSREVEWLRQIHLFNHLSEEEVGYHLSRMELRRFKKGTVIIPAGTRPDGLCIIRRGWVRLYKIKRNGEREPFGLLEERDYFGTGAVLENDVCRYEAVAVSDVEAYCWPFDELLAAMEYDERIKGFLRVVWRSRKRSLRRKPSWLSDDEIVYLLVGRTYWAFVPNNAPLVVAGIVSAVAAIFAALYDVLFFEWLTLFLLGFWVLWLVWAWIDWINDYGIVTNRRLAWVERVLLLYESRNEALLRSVISLSVHSDFMGQTMGYGDLVARTYGGSVRFELISDVEYVRALVSEYWERSQQVVLRESQEVVREQIRRRLGLPPRNVDQEGLPSSPLDTLPSHQTTVTKSWLSKTLERIFKQRRVLENGTIVYRKHPIRLIRRSIKPFVLLLLEIGLLVYLGRALKSLPPYLFLLLVFPLLWEIYQIWDWDNDQYLITNEHIVDVYRKPLGTEDRQESPLESIENITYERPGFLAMLFNYGDVRIQVGTTTMIFEAVGRPDRVQQEIYTRLEERLRRKQQEEAARERERMLDLLKHYHDVVSGDEEIWRQDREGGKE